MGYTLKVEHPHFSPETVFAISSLGAAKNGETVEVSEESERLFMTERGIPVEDAYKDDPLVTVSGSSALDQEEIDALTTVVPVEEEAETAQTAETETQAISEQAQEEATQIIPPSDTGGESS
jgi:hypothetical protein